MDMVSFPLFVQDAAEAKTDGKRDSTNLPDIHLGRSKLHDS